MLDARNPAPAGPLKESQPYPSPMPPVIATTGLTKSYGQTKALDGLEMEVAQGEVHGFLGPNGAGKTTTIRILLGLIRADGGQVALFGQDPWSEATDLHRRLAYVPGDVNLWPNLTGGEVIDLLGRMRGGVDTAKRDALLERFDLDPRKKGRTYSKGNRQKVALVAALASDVELLILDEPTAGLDPLMEAEFRACVDEDRHQGRTVLLASHILSEVEALCDRVSIVRAGKIVESGTLEELRHLTRTTISAQVTGDPSRLESMPGIYDLQISDHRLELEVDSVHIGAVLTRISELGVVNLTSHPPTLEELFMRHYRDEIET